MKRIAVTGANGFVGRHVVRHAVAAGHEVVGVVRSEAAAQVVRESGGYPILLVGRDPEALVRALDGCQAVVHLAQVGAERGGQTYEAVNIGFTERVLEDARHAGVPRVVYFSGLGVARY
ncbi:MAG TPA: NAD(P)H-binding protein, partial [Vicinamibacteria bacterium]